MAYRIIIQASAQREMRALPDQVFTRLDKRIQALSTTPRPPKVERLETGHPVYRFRVGDYRILYEIRDADRLVIITAVRHRREAYRRIP